MILPSGSGRAARAVAIVCVLGFVFPVGTVVAQPSDASLSALVGGIDPDSMRANLEVLSGERSFYVGDSVYTAEGGWLYDRVVRIPSRAWDWNDLSAHFIRERLASYGLTTWYHKPAGYAGVTNVLARIDGSTEPDRQILIGAHYDAVGTRGADDNGSGTVAVLEIARLLAGTHPERTILFGLWDAEEIGMVGSSRYAQEARARGDDIMAAINLDMIGWNRDDPGVLVASYDPWAGTWLEDRLLELAGDLGLPLDAMPYSMGRSDHVSFATAGFESVMLIEHYGTDFNPNYHTNNDTIDQIDFGYMTAITRWAAAGVASSAFDMLVQVDVEDVPVPAASERAPYPNPASGVVRFDVNDGARLELYDVLGRRVATDEGSEMDVSDLPVGLYAYRVIDGLLVKGGVLAVSR